jgi:hypothetical protein
MIREREGGGVGGVGRGRLKRGEGMGERGRMWGEVWGS